MQAVLLVDVDAVVAIAQREDDAGKQATSGAAGTTACMPLGSWERSPWVLT